MKRVETLVVNTVTQSSRGKARLVEASTLYLDPGSPRKTKLNCVAESCRGFWIATTSPGELVGGWIAGTGSELGMKENATGTSLNSEMLPATAIW